MNFSRDFGSVDTVLDHEQNDDAADMRTIVNLLTDQIEFANVLLNKTNLLSRDRVGELKVTLGKLNPKA